MSKELYTAMEKAPQRATLKALGLTDDELEKPLVAIVTARSEVAPANIHLDDIVEAVKIGVHAGGCTPITLPAISVCDGIAAGGVGYKYSLPSRELIADSVETMLLAHGFDGAVFIPNTDTAIAGMLMGAARANVPSVFVTGGPMDSGIFGDKKIGLASLYEGVGKVKCGSMSLDELTQAEAVACPAAGSANGCL